MVFSVYQQRTGTQMPISSYPLIIKGLNNITLRGVVDTKMIAYREKQIQSFTRLVEIIETSLVAGGIANPVWLDVKSGMNRILEHAWDSLGTASHLWNLSDDDRRIADDLHIYYPEMHTIVGKLKKLRSIKSSNKMFSLWLQIFEELRPIGEAFDILKNKTIKRQPKPVEDRVEKYNAPSVSATATGKVRDLLIQITEESKLELERTIVNDIKGVLKWYMDAQSKAIASGKTLGVYEHFCPHNGRVKNHGAALLVSGLVDGGINQIVAVHKPDYMDIIQKIAKNRASSIRENFVYKNLDKIAYIVEAKGNYKSGRVISHKIDLAGLTGTLFFDFDDGSNFNVKNSVVWVINNYGTEFNRYPLTFHNVVLADGSKMSRPSEQRMNEVFVK